MVPVLLIQEKKNEKIDMYVFPVHDCTQEQKGTNDRLSHERLLRSRNFATMVT